MKSTCWSVVWRPAAAASPESLLEMQNLRPQPRPTTEWTSADEHDSQIICMHVKDKCRTHSCSRILRGRVFLLSQSWKCRCEGSYSFQRSVSNWSWALFRTLTPAQLSEGLQNWLSNLAEAWGWGLQWSVRSWLRGQWICEVSLLLPESPARTTFWSITNGDRGCFKEAETGMSCPWDDGWVGTLRPSLVMSFYQRGVWWGHSWEILTCVPWNLGVCMNIRSRD